MEKLYKPTRKVVVCFSDGETWEEMNDEIKIVNLYGNGISDPHFVLHVQHLFFHDTKSL